MIWQKPLHMHVCFYYLHETARTRHEKPKKKWCLNTLNVAEPRNRREIFIGLLSLRTLRITDASHNWRIWLSTINRQIDDNWFERNMVKQRNMGLTNSFPFCKENANNFDWLSSFSSSTPNKIHRSSGRAAVLYLNVHSTLYPTSSSPSKDFS
jgi:hypothetical protein